MFWKNVYRFKEFKFGNRFSGNLQTWYWYEKKQWNVIPFVGTQFDWSERDRNLGIFNDYSGGYVLNGMIGTDIFIQNFGWGVSVKTPFYQNIGMGHIDNKIKCNFQFIFSLVLKKHIKKLRILYCIRSLKILLVIEILL